MSDNIVQFAKKQPVRLVWRCNCGCLTHFLHENGTVECAACSSTATGEGGSWRLPLPDAPDEPKEVVPGDTKVVDLGSVGAVVRRAIKQIDPDDVAALISVRGDGSMIVWSEDADTPERQRWFARKIKEAKALILAPIGKSA